MLAQPRRRPSLDHRESVFLPVELQLVETARHRPFDCNGPAPQLRGPHPRDHPHGGSCWRRCAKLPFPAKAVSRADVTRSHSALEKPTPRLEG